MWCLTINAISVGKNGNNGRRFDVQLNQFFLRKFFQQQSYVRQQAGLTEIKIDGISGPNTAKGILWFQKVNAVTGNGIAVDGLVNVINNRGVSAITHTVYTIVHLNRYFQMQGEGKEHFKNLENHPDIVMYAPELQAELAQWKFQE